VLAAVLACAGCRRPESLEAPNLSVELMELAYTEGVLAGIELPERATAWATMEEIIERALRADGDVATAVSAVLFDEMGFVREVDDQELRYLLLPSVLAGRRGSCVGLAEVYLAVAGSLRLPLSGVLVPGHFFVRSATDAGPRNVETLRCGEAMPDSWYRQRWAVPDGVSAYMRPLGAGETLAVVHFNLGNAYRRQRRLADALAHFTAAVELFGDFPEAHASQGLVRHLSGDLDGAAMAYDNARRLHPGLPGLELNLLELQRERSRRGRGVASP
jgi:regulator of sirC expression with transglutaminase-like and TPR domain